MIEREVKTDNTSQGMEIIGLEKITANNEQLLKDYALVELIFYIQGPAAAVRILACLRGWGLKS